MDQAQPIEQQKARSEKRKGGNGDCTLGKNPRRARERQENCVMKNMTEGGSCSGGAACHPGRRSTRPYSFFFTPPAPFLFQARRKSSAPAVTSQPDRAELRSHPGGYPRAARDRIVGMTSLCVILRTNLAFGATGSWTVDGAVPAAAESWCSFPRWRAERPHPPPLTSLHAAFDDSRSSRTPGSEGSFWMSTLSMR